MDSILLQRTGNYEIIIIDNASVDNTKSLIKNKYSNNVILTENSENYGFSKAINQGILMAKGRYILCLNHDVELKDKFLFNIQKAIESCTDIGAIQPKVFKSDNITIDTTGIHLSFLRRYHDIGHGQKDGDKFNKPRCIFGASAAAVLYRKETLDSIKQDNEYFDESFFCIAEDVDLSWRIRKKSWRTLYIPDAVCIHHGGISRHKSKYIQYLNMRNRYFMILKNETPAGILKLPIVFLLYDLWRNLVILITNPKYAIKTYNEIIKLFNKMLKKRHV